MKRRLWLIPLSILAVFLDSFVFPSLSGNGIRPLCALSLALAATAETKVQMTEKEEKALAKWV